MDETPCAGIDRVSIDIDINQYLLYSRLMDFATAAAITDLIDRITDPSSEFFEASDAQRLVELVPVQKPKIPFLFSSKGTKKTSGFTGLTDAGNFDYGHTEKRDIQVGGIRPQLIGEYKFWHEAGKLEVHKMWAETQQDQTGQKLRLLYNPRSKAPKKLQLYRDDAPREWVVIPPIGRFGGIVFDSSFSGFVDWKTPAPGS